MKRSVESYKHKAAKATLISWLRDAAKDKRPGTDDISASGLSWRLNRGPPYFGIWEEYPLVTSEDAEVCWDEQDWESQLESVRLYGDRDAHRKFRTIGDHTLKGFTSRRGRLEPVFWRTSMLYQDVAYPWMIERQPIPTYAELMQIGTRPKAIWDVAIQHKGSIITGIEIVHKHGLTDIKRAFLTTLISATYVVSADWILSQVEPPDRLVVQEAINPNRDRLEFSRSYSAGW